MSGKNHNKLGSLPTRAYLSRPVSSDVDTPAQVSTC
jgi:hypothetical protein